MKKRWNQSIGAMALALCLLLTGCGSKYSEQATTTEQSFGYEDGFFQEEIAVEDYEDYEESESAAGESTQTDTVTDPSANRKLIYYHDWSVETTSYDELIAAVHRVIDDCDAYIENSSEDSYGVTYRSERTCRMTIRVPQKNLDTMEQKLQEALGDTSAITSRSQRVEDITLTYTDVESRLTALRTEQDRLLELLKQAETVEDVLAIESRLSEVRYQLEDYESQKRLFDSQVNYSYLELSVFEVAVVSDAARETLGQRIVGAWQENGQSLVRLGEAIVIFLVGGLPYWAALAVVLLVIFLVVRKLLGKKRGKKPPMPPQS